MNYRPSVSTLHIHYFYTRLLTFSTCRSSILKYWNKKTMNVIKISKNYSQIHVWYITIKGWCEEILLWVQESLLLIKQSLIYKWKKLTPCLPRTYMYIYIQCMSCVRSLSDPGVSLYTSWSTWDKWNHQQPSCLNCLEQN